MLLYLLSADFFQNQLYRKPLSEIPSECQIVWIKIRPEILSGRILTQTVCKSYQQTTLGDHFSHFADFYQNQLVKSSFRNTIRVSNSLDPDQTRHFVGSDLDPNSETVCKSYQQTTLGDKEFLFVWFDSLRPINNLSIKQGQVFLGWTSTKLG